MYKESNGHWYVYMTIGGSGDEYDEIGVHELEQAQKAALSRWQKWLEILRVESTAAADFLRQRRKVIGFHRSDTCHKPGCDHNVYEDDKG